VGGVGRTVHHGLHYVLIEQLVGCPCVATEPNYNTINYMSLLYVIDMCPCVTTEVKDLYVTLIRNDKHHYNMQNPCRKHQLCISCLYCYGQGTVFFFLKLFGNP
jgi:hypothetical protein